MNFVTFTMGILLGRKKVRKEIETIFALMHVFVSQLNVNKVYASSERIMGNGSTKMAKLCHFF